MDSKDSRPSVSCVPPEIWRQIIFNLDLQSLSYSDLAVTWTNLRGVSRFFQAEIEALFQEMVLPGMKFDLWLKLDLESKIRQHASSDFHAVFDDQLKVPKPSSTLRRRIRCTFYRVCKDDGLATFYPGLERPMKEKRTVVFDKAFKMLEELCRRQVEGTFAQHYILQVSGVHNNLVIPEMRVRKLEWEICFDWRKLFSKLFSEEKVAMKLAKLSEEATKGTSTPFPHTEHIRRANDNPSSGILQQERHYHCVANDGDFRSHLRSKRFKDWYDHRCSYIAAKIPESAYFDRERVAQRLTESGLREYHLRFDRENYRRPVMPWRLLHGYNIVLPGNTDVESSEDDSLDYDEDSDEDYSESSSEDEATEDVLRLRMPQVILSRRAPTGEDPGDAASEPETSEHSMPEDSSN